MHFANRLTGDSDLQMLRSATPLSNQQNFAILRPHGISLPHGIQIPGGIAVPRGHDESELRATTANKRSQVVMRQHLAKDRSGTQQGVPYRVLIVDDDPDDVMLTRRALASTGWSKTGSLEITTAANGRDALDQLGAGDRFGNPPRPGAARYQHARHGRHDDAFAVPGRSAAAPSFDRGRDNELGSRDPQAGDGAGCKRGARQTLRCAGNARDHGEPSWKCTNSIELPPAAMAAALAPPAACAPY